MEPNTRFLPKMGKGMKIPRAQGFLLIFKWLSSYKNEMMKKIFLAAEKEIAMCVPKPTLAPWKSLNSRIQARIFKTVQKRTPSVHMSNRWSPNFHERTWPFGHKAFFIKNIWVLSSFFKVVAADFAVKRTATDFQSPGGIMLVPVGFLKHAEDQTTLIFSQRE